MRYGSELNVSLNLELIGEIPDQNIAHEHFL